MDYRWNDAKAAANLAKHGIDFVDAIGALADPNRIEDIDDSVASGEERTRTIGMTRGNILFVVTTMRDDDVCRIISARRATRYEQEQVLCGSIMNRGSRFRRAAQTGSGCGA